MTLPLYMVRMSLDRRELARRERRPRSIDEGYLLHTGITRLFATSDDPATSLIQPFALDEILLQNRPFPEIIPVLGYTSHGESELRSAMGSSIGSLLHRLEVKEVPEMPAGTLCEFRVRVCPVVRTKQAGGDPLRQNKKGRSLSREVDAWLAARFRDWQSTPPRDRQSAADTWEDRERVYRQWLNEEMTRTQDRPGITSAPAELCEARMVEFQREQFLRKQHSPDNSSRRRLERPDAVLEGKLKVLDAPSFRALLARGIGRHRAFGFGMLLMRRV